VRDASLPAAGSADTRSRHAADIRPQPHGVPRLCAAAHRRGNSICCCGSASTRARFRACVWLEHLLFELVAGFHAELAKRLA
jgi:hypothetical protein